MDQIEQLENKVAVLERQLLATPDGRIAARIAAIEAELPTRQAEHAALYAKADAWRGRFAALREEGAAVQRRVIEAQRARSADRSALENFDNGTRLLKEELAELRSQAAGVNWPVVRTRQAGIAPRAA